MSGNPEEEKDTQKAVPLDLVRTQMSTVVTRSVESTNNKAPLMMTSQALRSVRVLTQGIPSSSSNSAPVGQTIITGLVQGTVIKQVGTTPQQQQSQPLQQQQQQLSGTTISVQQQQQQRPTQQITLSTTSIVAAAAAASSPAAASYHVPRGPAVVANLAAPRSNVTTIRTPLVVAAQTNFVRPPRTLSPAQAATWLTNANNANSLKTGILSSSPTIIRATTITGNNNNNKSQILPTRSNQIPHASVSSIRTGTIISNAINIGQTTMHSFKPASGTSVQLNNTVTLAQMLPSSTRTQALVYSGINNNNNSPQFNPAARITITTTAAPNSSIRPQHSNIRPPGSIISGTRLTVPIAQVQAAQNARMISPSVVNQRIPVVVSSTTTQQPVLATTARLVTTQASGNVVGRLAVNSSTVVPAGSAAANILTSQTRISTLSSLNFQSLMAVANGAAAGRVQPKVITQPAAIHLAQIPSQIKSTSSSSSSHSAIVTTGGGGNRTVNVPASIVAQRAINSGGVTSQAISIGGKIFSTTLENPVIGSGATSVFIHTPLSSQQQQQRHPSPNPSSTTQPPTTSTQQYSSISSNQEGNSFYYDNNNPASSATTGGTFPKTTTFVAQTRSNNNNNNSQQFQGMRISSVMVLDQSRGGGTQQSSSSQIHAISSVSDHQSLLDQQQQQQQNRVVSSSPRPSILRKRDHEGAPLKAAKNLSSVLLGLNHQQNPAPTSPLSPQEPDSRENGHSSGGSTTISATSSPGLPEINEENSLTPMNIIINNKDDDEEEEEEEEEEELKPPIEMSPRKKPRKQQLTGNDNDENHDDMQFISENNLEKKGNFESDGSHSDNSPKNNAALPELSSKLATLRKRNTPSLLNGYRQTWKATHNHFQRYSDVKPKEERKPTIIDLANQNRVLEKINGWKIYHLSTQMEDLAGQEHSVHDQLSDLLKYTESEENTTKEDKEVNRVNELIKGNLQRIKIINDGMLDAKCQIMKVIDHKRHVNDILSRCVSKRNFKKREKS